jgi:hypothetical protein
MNKVKKGKKGIRVVISTYMYMVFDEHENMDEVHSHDHMMMSWKDHNGLVVIVVPYSDIPLALHSVITKKREMAQNPEKTDLHVWVPHVHT